MNSAHQRVIHAFIKRIARRLHAAILCERLLTVLTVGLIALLLGVGLVPLAPTQPWLVSAVAILAWGAMAFALARLLQACLQRRPLESAAFYVEAKRPELHNHLISALQLPESLQKHPESGISSDLVDSLLEVTQRQVESLSRQPLVDWGGVRRQLRVATPLVVAMLGVAWVAPQLIAVSVAQLLDPLGSLTGQPTLLTLGEYPRHVLAGQPLTLEVMATGRLPSTVHLRIWQAGKEREEKMVAGDQGTFRHTFSHLREPVKFQAIAGSAASGVGEVEAVEAPAVGNVRLRYQYPDYTRLPPKIEEGTGHIETLAGSEVRIEMAANKPIAWGQLVFDDHTQLPLLVRQDGLLQATAIVTKPGGYRVQVQDALGFTNQEQLSYRVDVIPDEAPQVDLLAPEPDLEIEEGQVIGLEYEARDDFGVRELALVYRTGAFGDKRLVIDRVDEVARRYEGRYYWDVTDLFSEAGERVTYHLEVWDNDTVSGPKRGVSATHVLRIKSREEDHRRLDEMQQQVAEQLTDLLADQLELNARTADLTAQAVPHDPTAAQELAARQAELQQQAQDLVSQLDRMLQLLEKDYLSDYTRYEDTQTLRETLDFTQDTLMGDARRQLSPPPSQAPPSTPSPRNPQQSAPQPSGDRAPSPDQALAKQEAAQSELERMALFAQDIGKRSKVRDLENVAQRMARTQKNLLDALTDLDKLGKEMDAATRDALERELNELEKAMQALMEALSKLPSELPDEFLNSEALQNLELSDMMQTLQQLREQLQQGNLAEAKRLAEDLLSSMNQMLAALQSAQRFAQSMPFGQQQSGMERTQSELDQIAQEQSEILRDTGAIDKSLRRRINEQQRQEFERLRQQLRETIDRAQRQLQEAKRGSQADNRRSRAAPPSTHRLDRALDRIRRQLTPEESAELLRALQDAAQELSAMQQHPSPTWEEFLRTHPELQAMLQDLHDGLSQSHQRLADLNSLDGQELLDPQQGEELGQLGQRQQAVRERTEALKSRLDQLSQFIPFLSPELRQNIGEAGEFMGEARGELSERRARQAIPPEEEALRRLSQGQQAMQQAMQQMAQRGQMGQMPVPMVLRRPGDPFAFDQQPFPDRSPREQGRMGVNTRDFKIPGKEEYKAPKQFREEIMEALKRGAPSQFKGQIEQYFKNLTE
ncbi:MAG TPA: DUF4175 family protein [Candidatus Tectomicrobia bacterium]|nr:DUF4175 family protein [Candidatus Tectomicrobia bacterium]